MFSGSVQQQKYIFVVVAVVVLVLVVAVCSNLLCYSAAVIESSNQGHLWTCLVLSAQSLSFWN